MRSPYVSFLIATFLVCPTFALIILLTSSTSILGEDKWPENVDRAWIMKEAKDLTDGTSDPACVGNILLLIGQRLYLALDQNTANENDFSKLPVLLEKGFFIEEVTQNKDTITARARHKEGKRKLIFTPASDGQYVLRITFTDKVVNDYKLHFVLQTVNQKSAKERLRKILKIGELQGSIQMKPISEWLANE